MKTYLAKTGEIKREHILFDASEMPVGRLAVKIVNALRGKDKPTFTPHIDTGAFVIVINASKAVFTGRKSERKVYVDYTGYRGGRSTMTAEKVREREPKRLIVQAVTGMLPGNHLCKRMLKRLKVFVGPEHTHAAQKTVAVELV